MTDHALTLREFLSSVKSAVNASFPVRYWITAELAELRVHPNSLHCYCRLIEKDESRTVARVDGVIWKDRFSYLAGKFREATGRDLGENLKVLLCAEVLFHELYGFKLSISDINPAYTLGELALQRENILRRLRQEGMLEKNRQLEFPPVPQRVAVISSESAAGYEDFINVLDNNPYGYRFSVILFPASMQGERTEESMLEALTRFNDAAARYDVVAIIRGGGDTVDLNSFDNYNIGKAIAISARPVLTGIGHTRDATVADMASFKSCPTPTAVGEFLVSCMRSFEERVMERGRTLAGAATGYVARSRAEVAKVSRDIVVFTRFFQEAERKRFRGLLSDFRNSTAGNIAGQEFQMVHMPGALLKSASLYIRRNREEMPVLARELNVGISGLLSRLDNRVERCADKVNLMDPEAVLKRGYTLTTHQGQVIRNPSTLKPGDIVRTRFYSGSIKSRVERIDENVEER